MKVTLEIIKGPETGRKFDFSEPDTFLVGRAKDATFRLPEEDPYVSRRHFHLEINPPNIIFRDLESKNPPRINDKVTIERKLKDGDIIEVGYTLMKVTISDIIETKTTPCKKCGVDILVLKNEDSPIYCEPCQKLIEQGKRDKAFTGEIPVTCKCGKNLTKEANSDKRALELLDKVTYLCPGCLPSGDSEKGTKINDYEVIKKIGEGGMGKVYLVYHRLTGRILVCKKIIGIPQNDMLKRFEREIRFQSSLSHPNIIQFIDSGIHQKEPYLIIEFATGGDLNKLMIDNSKPLKSDMAVKYMIESLKGIEYLHANKIIHRDIKPENILLQKNKNGVIIPKITDLGIAKSINNAGGSSLTKAGIAMGTVFYMPPEQIRDARSVDEKADLYSMGVVLYYLLTGKYPYDFPTQLDVIRWMLENKGKFKNEKEAFDALLMLEKAKNPLLIILSENPIPIRNRDNSIPVALAGIVDKAVNKSISQRFRTATEFRKELELFAPGLGDINFV
jgi:eukaryotic-like serine/threonine-protein kinase